MFVYLENDPSKTTLLKYYQDLRDLLTGSKTKISDLQTAKFINYSGVTWNNGVGTGFTGLPIITSNLQYISVHCYLLYNGTYFQLGEISNTETSGAYQPQPSSQGPNETRITYANGSYVNVTVTGSLDGGTWNGHPTFPSTTTTYTVLSYTTDASSIPENLIGKNVFADGVPVGKIVATTATTVITDNTTFSASTAHDAQISVCEYTTRYDAPGWQVWDDQLTGAGYVVLYAPKPKTVGSGYQYLMIDHPDGISSSYIYIRLQMWESWYNADGLDANGNVGTAHTGLNVASRSTYVGTHSNSASIGTYSTTLLMRSCAAGVVISFSGHPDRDGSLDSMCTGAVPGTSDGVYTLYVSAKRPGAAWDTPSAGYPCSIQGGDLTRFAVCRLKWGSSDIKDNSFYAPGPYPALGLSADSTSPTYDADNNARNVLIPMYAQYSDGNGTMPGGEFSSLLGMYIFSAGVGVPYHDTVSDGTYEYYIVYCSAGSGQRRFAIKRG
jgi:hypothetical protein